MSFDHPETRYAAAVEYDGGCFYGFQRQAQEPTVQSVLEHALGAVANHPVIVHGAGRTDTGVHASAQIIHFCSPARRSVRSWMLGANSKLPEACVVRWVREVGGDFHARFSATSRRYRYSILNRSVRPVLRRSTEAWVREELNEQSMQHAARALVGEYDFDAFRASSCQADHAVRRIFSLVVTRQENRVFVDIHGNAFLHHMVRNIVGSLILVGTGEKTSDWLQDVLRSRDRRNAGPPAQVALNYVALAVRRHNAPRHVPP